MSLNGTWEYLHLKTLIFTCWWNCSSIQEYKNKEKVRDKVLELKKI